MTVQYYNDADIFSSRSQCLIIPVNCMGVMGAGLALEFKRRFPEIMPPYRKMCRNGTLCIGAVGFFKAKRMPYSVCFFPTKLDWRNPSTIEFLDSSLVAFIKHAPRYNIQRAAFPKIGCGKGGLNFEFHVQPLLERRFTSIDMDIEVYV